MAFDEFYMRCYQSPLWSFAASDRYPAGHAILSGNIVSGDITTFAVNDDGTLTSTRKIFEAVSPSAIQFFTADN